MNKRDNRSKRSNRIKTKKRSNRIKRSNRNKRSKINKRSNRNKRSKRSKISKRVKRIGGTRDKKSIISDYVSNTAEDLLSENTYSKMKQALSKDLPQDKANLQENFRERFDKRKERNKERERKVERDKKNESSSYFDWLTSPLGFLPSPTDYIPFYSKDETKPETEIKKDEKRDDMMRLFLDYQTEMLGLMEEKLSKDKK
tara:strand:+ start:270 stop:869 length:600 start_codon:yes stop_codon:yes gene_type:complete